jgi:hypothetical protein
MHASVSPATDIDAVVADLGVLMKHLLVSSSRDFFAAVEQAGLTFTQVKCLHRLGDSEEPLPLNALS